MLNSSDQLCNITRWRTKKPAEATKLGNVMQELLDRISPLQVRLGLIAELWERLIPAKLRRHCRIAGVSGRGLKILADSPSFASEMRWYSQNLLKEIREQCPRAGIKEIHCVVGQERA
jgi:predicted nucleic acid-binding Zn ribbon protein